MIGKAGRRFGIGRRGLVAGLLFVSAAGGAPAEASPATDRQAVVDTLEASAAAWSKGDLDGFMRSYEESPLTTYIGKSGPVHGANAIKAMYAARFGKGAASMGALSLSVLDYRPLCADVSLLTGRFALHRPGAADASGIFTLVFHKSAAGWRIVSDHTS